MIPTVCAIDVSANEALVYAMVGALIALVPILTTLIIVVIQAYAKIRQAWTIANENRVALHEQVLPAIEAARKEGSNAHAETVRLINGNGGGTKSA